MEINELVFRKPSEEYLLYGLPTLMELHFSNAFIGVNFFGGFVWEALSIFVLSSTSN